MNICKYTSILVLKIHLNFTCTFDTARTMKLKNSVYKQSLQVTVLFSCRHVVRHTPQVWHDLPRPSDLPL